MMSGGTKTSSLAVALLFVLLLVCPSLSQTASGEYQVKATFLFNFAKFIEWPSRSFKRPADPFTFCLAGDPFSGELEKIIKGESLNGRPLIVRRLGSGDPVSGCHTVFVARSEAKRTPELINSAAGQSILTVGEEEDFIEHGGMIRLVESAGNVRFEINPEAAVRVGLRVSSRLLRLADIVHPRKRPGARRSEA